MQSTSSLRVDPTSSSAVGAAASAAQRSELGSWGSLAPIFLALTAHCCCDGLRFLLSPECPEGGSVPPGHVLRGLSGAYPAGMR